MAAYAALVSVTHIIEQIQHHPRPPISLDKRQVESLIGKVTFLQDFLEAHSLGSSEGADDLESRIADAAYAEEDVIESHVVDEILAGSASHGEDVDQALQKVIEDMELIEKEVMEIKERMGIRDQLHQNSMPTGSSRSPHAGQNAMIGFVDALNEIMDKLIGQRPNRQIIPIVGMGGIGKTTLARHVYENPLIGGLLAKTEQTRKYWEYIAENLNSIVSSEDNERCLKILQMRYNQLSVHLKPCFLYMGVFPKDSVIRISWIIKLWDAEGFLKPRSEKSLEVVAEEYFMELVDRNLILVCELGSNGKIKSCSIHDPVRDICLKLAQRGKFLCVIRQNNFNISQDVNTQRRIGIHQMMTGPEVLDALQSAPLARSLICDFDVGLPLLNFKLLRVLKSANKDSKDEHFLARL